MTDTPERALLRRLVEENDHCEKMHAEGAMADQWVAKQLWNKAIADARALLAQPAAEGRRWQSDLTVDQHLLCDNSGAGKVTVDPALLSPSPHLSRAEVEALREALGEITKGDGVYYLTQEAAMAPGISGKWPDVIPAPHTPHGRLVKRALLAARKGEG